MKRIKFLVLVSLLLFAFTAKVNAANVAKIGDNEYATLELAISSASAGDTITLIDDISVSISTQIEIDKNLTIDLNGHNITSTTNKIFIVTHGNVKFTGAGVIEAQQATNSPIKVTGSTNVSDSDYTVVTIDKNVTLKGGYGLFVHHINNLAYGVRIEFYGKAQTTYGGLFVNGGVHKGTANNIVINLYDGVEFQPLEGVNDANGGIYAAGYAIWNIGKVKMTGYDAGLAIKSGVFNIDGAEITCYGPDQSPTSGYSDGIEASGAAIQIESNAGYAGDIELNIKSGKFVSQNGVAIYDYKNGNDALAITSISVSGGAFVSGDDKAVILSSEEFDESDLKQFITGGTFSSDVRDNVKDGYKVYTQNDLYYVKKVTVDAGSLKISGHVATDVTVKLTKGSQILKTVETDANGDYEFTDLAKGVYNLVFTKEDTSTMELVNLTANKVVDIDAMPMGSVVITTVGSNTIDMLVDGLEDVSNFSDVELVISTPSESEEGAKAIIKAAKGKTVDLAELTIYKEDTELTTTDNVLHFVFQYDFTNKNNVVIYRYHDSKVNTFTELDSMPTTYEDGTYYLDKDNGLIHIFSKKFSTYAVGYDTIANPDTSDNIKVITTTAIVSLTGIVTALYLNKKRIFG